MIIPSIDLLNGKAVQLRGGREKILEREDVLKLAEEFSLYGELAVIDLDSAFGTGSNIDLIKKICKIADCRVGGGVRSLEKANDLFKAGAKKIIVGTKATPDFLDKLPKDRLIVAVDSKDGFVVNEGWTNNTFKTPFEFVKDLEDFCSEFLFTDVDKEGLMDGIQIDFIKKLKKATEKKLTIAGGITSIDDVIEIDNLNANSQIGMALYSGKLNLSEVFVSLLNFNKCNGLIPTIVQDLNKQVLMLAYSSRESLIKTFKLGNAVYYSRSRGKIWVKGESSGNNQKIIRVKFDCDKDTLLFVVDQKNSACHRGNYSCFGSKEFNFNDLYNEILGRVNNIVSESYTSNISKEEFLIKEKIKEESQEIIDYKDRDNLIWEIADLTYFIMILMAKKNISIFDIENELWRRKKWT